MPSCLITDNAITHLFYNDATNPKLVEGFLAERSIDQTMTPLTAVTKIGDILHEAMVLKIEMLVP